MFYLFTGDSLTEGCNNGGKGYAHYVKEMTSAVCAIDGVSGTTIGSYSPYPVNRYCLASRLDMIASDIRCADAIVLEFGLNDVTAIECGLATFTEVVIAFVSAVDAIRQLNPKAKVYYITIGGKDVIKAASRFQGAYIREEYLAGYPISFKDKRYATMYACLMNAFSLRAEPLVMFKDVHEYVDHLDSDRLHPDAVGYEIAARNIAEQLRLEE